MEEMLDILRKKLPNLSNMDIELIRSVVVNYAVGAIRNIEQQEELLRQHAEIYGLPKKKRGRPRKNLPSISPSISELEFNPSDEILNRKRLLRRKLHKKSLENMTNLILGKKPTSSSDIEE